MKEYYVVAMENLATDDGRRWIKGEKYAVIEGELDFYIECEQMQLCYVIGAKEAVLEHFERVED